MFLSRRTRVLRHTTIESPSGGEGEADSEAEGHVAVATWRGWGEAGGVEMEERDGGWRGDGGGGVLSLQTAC